MNYKQMLDKFEYLEQQIEHLESEVQRLKQHQHYSPVSPLMPQTNWPTQWQMPVTITCDTNPQDGF